MARLRPLGARWRGAWRSNRPAAPRRARAGGAAIDSRRASAAAITLGFDPSFVAAGIELARLTERGGMPTRVHRASRGEAAESPLPAIELRNVVKDYEGEPHGIRALDDVSLRVAAGEIIAIHGPSGAGKTTLLHVIAGRCAPSRGAVLIFGRHIEHERDESIRRLLESTVRTAAESELIGSLSVLDNLVLTLFTRMPHSRSITHARSRDALEALSAVGMQRRTDAVFAALSSGERQRVVIARALVGEPRIVLVDEPGRNLDWRGAEYVVDLLVRARATSGAAIVLATHDVRTAVRADRIVVLRNGALVDEIRASHVASVDNSHGR